MDKNEREVTNATPAETWGIIFTLLGAVFAVGCFLMWVFRLLTNSAH